ncbi:Cadherin-23 [Liparis tanakae]|uniref:Cadherin-23 n=1 Tax=Liparis tanakae TaxID=230148 RepID=A0A4Z2ECU1_9TELE|nr:Cadherin-23 [Liparis tanakae]
MSEEFCSKGLEPLESSGPPIRFWTPLTDLSSEFSLLQTSTTISVHIVDENDNAPEFPEEEYVTVLSEGPDTVGATIATVTALDPDEGPNGTLRYAIAQGNLVQTFGIDSLTVRD